MSKWEKLRSLPNVRVGVHLADLARNNAAVLNGGVLPAKEKHK